MKAFVIAAVYVACLTSALSPVDHEQSVLVDQQATGLSLIELDPGVTRWVTDEDKWALRRVVSLGSHCVSTPLKGSTGRN